MRIVYTTTAIEALNSSSDAPYLSEGTFQEADQAVSRSHGEPTEARHHFAAGAARINRQSQKDGNGSGVRRFKQAKIRGEIMKSTYSNLATAAFALLLTSTALSTATPRMQPSDHAGSNFLLAQAECNADETPETCAARQAQEEVAPPTEQPAPEAPAEQPAEAPSEQPAPEVPAEKPAEAPAEQPAPEVPAEKPAEAPAEQPASEQQAPVPETPTEAAPEAPAKQPAAEAPAEQSDQPAPTPQAPAAPAPEAPAPEQPAAEQPVQPAPEQPGRPAPEQQAPGPEAPTSEQPALAPAAPSAPAPAEPATPAPAAPAPAGPATQQPAQSGAAVPAEGAAAPVLDSQKRPRNRQGGGQQPAPEQARPAVPVEPAGPPPADDRAAAEAAQPAEVVPVTREQGTRRERAPEARERERPQGAEVIGEANEGRTIIRFGGNVFVEGDERPRLSRGAREVYYEDLPRGRVREVILRENGVQVVTIRNQYGDVIRRSRIMPDGREYVLAYVDDRNYDRVGDWRDPGLDLAPMQLTVPVEDYILDAGRVNTQTNTMSSSANRRSSASSVSTRSMRSNGRPASATRRGASTSTP